MKTLSFFNLGLTIHITLFLVLGTAIVTKGQDVQPLEDHKNYVVVGVFEHENNAQGYSEFLASGKNMPVKYKYNTHLDYYYVYAFESENRDEAKRFLFKTRDDYPDLGKTWLYSKKRYVLANREGQAGGESYPPHDDVVEEAAYAPASATVTLGPSAKGTPPPSTNDLLDGADDNAIDEPR